MSGWIALGYMGILTLLWCLIYSGLRDRVSRLEDRVKSLEQGGDA